MGVGVGMEAGAFGLYYGVVQKGEDPEKLNRLPVKLDHDDTQTHLAHVLMPMGWYTLPDAGDKVMVVFIGGKLERPVVVGGVWNKAARPPEVNEDGKNNFRGYCSRAGHRLIFDDSDKPKVVLAGKTNRNRHDQANKHVVGIGNFPKAGAGQNVCEVFQTLANSKMGVAISATGGSATLEIACKGALTVTAETITLNAEDKLEVKADGKVTMDGSTVKLSSSQQFNDDLKLDFV